MINCLAAKSINHSINQSTSLTHSVGGVVRCKLRLIRQEIINSFIDYFIIIVTFPFSFADSTLLMSYSCILYSFMDIIIKSTLFLDHFNYYAFLFIDYLQLMQSCTIPQYPHSYMLVSTVESILLFLLCCCRK